MLYQVDYRDNVYSLTPRSFGYDKYKIAILSYENFEGTVEFKLRDISPEMQRRIDDFPNRVYFDKTNDSFYDFLEDNISGTNFSR